MSRTTTVSPTFVERLMSRFTVDSESGCWVWTGTLTRGGYGQIARGDRNVTAHRAMWEHLREPIADALVIDHLCLRRACVNPDHLEVVTYSENNFRRFSELSGSEKLAQAHRAPETSQPLSPRHRPESFRGATRADG